MHGVVGCLGFGLGFFHGSFRVQQFGLLPVIVIGFGTAVYRIAQDCFESLPVIIAEPCFKTLYSSSNLAI